MGEESHNMKTRKERAEKMLERLKRGPMLTDNCDSSPITAAQAIIRYQNWFISWIEADLINLVPELRKQHE